MGNLKNYIIKKLGGYTAEEYKNAAGIRAMKCGIERPWADEYQKPKSRKYYRKCGVCGERHEQSEMIRTNRSPNGWVCFDCHNAEHPEYDIE